MLAFMTAGMMKYDTWTLLYRFCIYVELYTGVFVLVVLSFIYVKISKELEKIVG
jgi:Flp pilus assembly protein protease CpaA